MGQDASIQPISELADSGAGVLPPSALLALFRLSSAALPIGAFAYSQGLEQAVALGDVRCAESASAWISCMLEQSIVTLDVPLLVRLHAAEHALDDAAFARWNDYLFASRGTAELRAEERQLGSALAKLLMHEGVARAARWVAAPRVTLAGAFSIAAVAWQAPVAATCLAYMFAWAEAQVGAAVRSIPLGQTQAQHVLSALLTRAADYLPVALSRTDDTISSTTPGQLVLSGLHETQYSRLFRS